VNAEENLIESLNYHSKKKNGGKHGNVYGEKSHRYTDIQRKIFRVDLLLQMWQ
jgi:hypothetical protein